MEIDDGCREIGVLGSAQRRLRVAGRENRGASSAQRRDDLKRHKRLILRDEDDTSIKSML
jgi:hypothetical protein